MAFTVSYRISNGTPPYTATITGSGLADNIHTADGTFLFVNVPEGTYNLDITDSLGCFATLPVVLVTTTSTTEAPIPTCKLSDFQTQTTDSTNNNGTITVINVVGGQGTITYSIDAGLNYQSSNVFTNLSAGIYSVCVKDDFIVDCTFCKPINVFQITQLPTYSLSLENVIPNGGNSVSGDGSQFNPYPSNTEINFNVVGNGGTGTAFPATYILQAIGTANASNGMQYKGGFYSNNQTIQLTTPYGEVTTASEVDQFNGGWGVLSGQNSFIFVNTNLLGGGVIELGIKLLLNGVQQDTFTLWFDDGGSVNSP